MSPTFDASGLVSIILPTYQESEGIEAIIRDLLERIRDPVEIIVVDDASPDGTADVVEAIGDPRVKVVRRQARGLASATLRGIIESRGSVVGWIDADAWMMPAHLPEMIERLAEYDIVIASRYVPGGGDVRGPVRQVASRMLNGWARLMLGRDIQDWSSNFVVVRRSVFDAVVPDPTGYAVFFIDLIVRARAKGLTVLELPYVLAERHEGISKSFPSVVRFLRIGAEYGMGILKTRLRNIERDRI